MGRLHRLSLAHSPRHRSQVVFPPHSVRGSCLLISHSCSYHRIRQWIIIDSAALRACQLPQMCGQCYRYNYLHSSNSTFRRFLITFAPVSYLCPLFSPFGRHVVTMAPLFPCFALVAMRFLVEEDRRHAISPLSYMCTEVAWYSFLGHRCAAITMPSVHSSAFSDYLITQCASCAHVMVTALQRTAASALLCCSEHVQHMLRVV